jgi:hypothetical protein
MSPCASRDHVKNSRIELFTFKVIEQHGARCEVSVPLPTAKVALGLEIKYVLDTHRRGYSFSADFKKLAEEARVLNALYYSDKLSSDEEFWTCIHRVNAYSADAYITVSAFIAVVVEPQNPAVADHLKPINYAIAAVENFNMYKRKFKRGDDVLLVSLSKYVQRFLRCYNKVKPRNARSSKNYPDVVDRIVKLRGHAVPQVSVDLDMYKQVIVKLESLADELKDELRKWVADNFNTRID